jgi:putative tricarboxylic transport membrane protein
MQASAKSAPFVILFCVALFLFSLTLQFDFPHAPGRLGPDVWPQAILVLLMLTCAIGVARNFLVRPPDEAAQPAAWSAGEEAEVEVPSRYMLVILGFALFLIYPVALEYLGFLAATLLLMALFMWIGQWRSPLGVLATSAIGTLVLFYAFRGIVYVSLPLGVGPFQEWTVWVAQLLNMR